MITCTRCTESKPLDAFPVRAQKRNGRSSWCKACHDARSAEWHRHNAEAIAARRAKREAELDRDRLPDADAVIAAPGGSDAKYRERVRVRLGGA